MYKTYRGIGFVYRNQSWAKRNTMGTRKRTGFQLIYPGSSLKKDSKYSSTRAISMQMIWFSQNLQSA